MALSARKARLNGFNMQQDPQGRAQDIDEEKLPLRLNIDNERPGTMAGFAPHLTALQSMLQPPPLLPCTPDLGQGL